MRLKSLPEYLNDIKLWNQSHCRINGDQLWLSHLAVLFYGHLWFIAMGILNMKRMLLLLALITPVAVNAEPASQIAWTPEVLNLVKNGDLNKGKGLAESCKSCHGEKGQGMKEETSDGETLPAIPALAGQVATYTYKQLRDYANGSRSHDSMTGIAKGLKEQDAADVAVWFSSLPAQENKSGSRNLARARKNG